jgi:hypothetical protein
MKWETLRYEIWIYYKIIRQTQKYHRYGRERCKPL